MKKSALRKDFYMEIVKTRGRFLSILFIVALGVAFFSGIRASEPDIRYSGDAYFDEHNYYDIKILGTLGLTNEDIEAVSKLDGVDTVEGVHSTDVICNVKNSQKVLHVMSLTDKLNQLTVDKGRLPEKNNECLIDNKFMEKSGFKLGDWIVFESGNEDQLEDTLAANKYKIVGIGSSPNYISYNRGSSSIGTGEVVGFVYLSNKGFTQDVYTDLDISVVGAKELTAFTSPYETAVQEVLDRVKSIKKERSNIRRESLVADAEIKIQDAEKELADGKTKADTELSKANQELADADVKLQDGRTKLQDGKNAIQEAKNTLNKNQKDIDVAKNQYEDGINQLNVGIRELNTQVAKYNEESSKATAQIMEGERQLKEGRAGLDEQWAQYQALVGVAPPEALAQMKAALDAGEVQWNTQKGAIEQAKAQLSQGEAAIEQAKIRIDESQAQLNAALNQINSGQTQINNGWTELTGKQTELDAAEKDIIQGEADYQKGKAEYDKAKKEADDKIADGEKKVADAKKKIEEIEVPKWYVKDRNFSSDYTGYGENADRMRAIGLVFPIIFFLVAALISLTSMTRMVEEQRTQIGTLKALGYSKLSIAKKYLYYALLATVGGSAVGVLIGEKVLPYVIVFAYKIMYENLPNIEIPYNLQYAVMATVAAVSCTVVATMMSCYAELAAQPAVLMRPPTPKKGKRIILERITFIWNRLNFTWKSTMRNLFRYKKRFFMTVFGIGGCMALMLVGFGLKDAILGIADIQYGQINLYDETAFLKDDVTQEEKDQLNVYLEKEDQISDYTEILMKSVSIGSGSKNKDVYLCIPKDSKNINQFIVFKDRKDNKKYHLKEDGVILTEKASRIFNKKAGDKIDVDLGDGIKKEVKISAVCENYMGHYLYMTPGLYQSLKGEAPKYNGVLLETNESTQQENLQIGENLLKNQGVLNVSYTSNIEGQLSDMLGSLNIVIVVLIISAGMLAFVVLYNLNTININERKRELATIKVLGFYDIEVAAYVYRENILLTFIGCGAGCLLGKVLHRFVVATVEIEDVMFGRNIDFPSFVYSTLFTVGFSLFVNAVMYYKLKKIDMVESLKSVE
ncbi:MAG: FtsX-like permease family protein [Lachnospiraceae bacterium]